MIFTLQKIFVVKSVLLRIQIKYLSKKEGTYCKTTRSKEVSDAFIILFFPAFSEYQC